MRRQPTILGVAVEPHRRPAWAPLATWPISSPLCTVAGRTEAAIVWIRYRCDPGEGPIRLVVRQGAGPSGLELGGVTAETGDHVARIELPYGFAASAPAILVESGRAFQSVPLDLVTPDALLSRWSMALGIRLGASSRERSVGGFTLTLPAGIASLSLRTDPPFLPDESTEPPAAPAASPAACAATAAPATENPETATPATPGPETPPSEGGLAELPPAQVPAPWWVRLSWRMWPESDPQFAVRLLAEHARRQTRREDRASRATIQDSRKRKAPGANAAPPIPEPAIGPSVRLWPSLSFRDAAPRPRWPTAVAFSDERAARTRYGVGDEVLLTPKPSGVRAWAAVPAAVAALLTPPLVTAVDRLYTLFPGTRVEITPGGLLATLYAVAAQPDAIQAWFAGAGQIVAELDRVAPVAREGAR